MVGIGRLDKGLVSARASMADEMVVAVLWRWLALVAAEFYQTGFIELLAPCWKQLYFLQLPQMRTDSRQTVRESRPQPEKKD